MFGYQLRFQPRSLDGSLLMWTSQAMLPFDTFWAKEKWSDKLFAPILSERVSIQHGGSVSRQTRSTQSPELIERLASIILVWSKHGAANQQNICSHVLICTAYYTFFFSCARTVESIDCCFFSIFLCSTDLGYFCGLNDVHWYNLIKFVNILKTAIFILASKIFQMTSCFCILLNIIYRLLWTN